MHTESSELEHVSEREYMKTDKVSVECVQSYALFPAQDGNVNGRLKKQLENFNFIKICFSGPSFFSILLAYSSPASAECFE